MATITKKELIDRIAESTGHRRVQVKKVVQQFLDEIVKELGKGNRLEFRDFGVFESKIRKARRAQNPKDAGTGVGAGEAHGQIQSRPADEAADGRPRRGDRRRPGRRLRG